MFPIINVVAEVGQLWQRAVDVVGVMFTAGLKRSDLLRQRCRNNWFGILLSVVALYGRCAMSHCPAAKVLVDW
jgi:hypothetical protein